MVVLITFLLLNSYAGYTENNRLLTRLTDETGKQTANLGVTGDEIKYIYRVGRLTEIHYPQHSDNNVHFLYDPAGRIALRQDGTGSEEFVYDHLGNVAQSVRRIVVPTENQAYVFRTLFKYDSFGRIRNIIYPDGEAVHYGYTTGGLLKNVVGLKQGDNSVYLWNRIYDEQGRKIFQLAGNGVRTDCYKEEYLPLQKFTFFNFYRQSTCTYHLF